MEEGSSMVMFEKDKVLPEKKVNNRTYKTPFQLEALEKLYTEHKYPREWMKIEVAANIGLTEKQVSIWFCHRRNKDKNVLIDESCENERLDRSSGVIQDHGQDSCDSTKPGDHRYAVDPRDDTSSDSSSGLQDVFNSRGVIPFGVKSSKYLTQNEAIISQKISNYTASLRPSGYLKMRGNIEHAAISDVKRQLGKHFRQDGPVLGIEFESLTPGAFEIPQRELDNEPYSVTDPTIPHLPQFTNTRKQVVAGQAYDVNSSKIISQKSFTENEYVKTLQRHISQINYPHHQATYKSSRPNYFSNPSSDRSSSLLTSEDFARNPPCYTNRMDNMRLHSPLYYEKTTKEQRNHYDDIKSMIVKKEEFLRSKPSTPLLWNNGALDMEDEESSRKVLKDENHYGGRSGSREYRKPTREKLNPTTDVMISRDEAI